MGRLLKSFRSTADEGIDRVKQTVHSYSFCFRNRDRGRQFKRTRNHGLPAVGVVVEDVAKGAPKRPSSTGSPSMQTAIKGGTKGKILQGLNALDWFVECQTSVVFPGLFVGITV